MNTLGLFVSFLTMHLVLASPIKRNPRNVHNGTRRLLSDDDMCDQSHQGPGLTFQEWLPYFMNLEEDYKNVLDLIACKFNDECNVPTFASYQPSQDSISPKARCAREYINKVMETLEKYLDTFLNNYDCLISLEKNEEFLGDLNILTNDLYDTTELHAPLVIEAGQSVCPKQLSSLYKTYVNSLRDFGSFLTNVIGVLKSDSFGEVE